jgi:hypothetical protein
MKQVVLMPNGETGGRILEYTKPSVEVLIRNMSPHFNLIIILSYFKG